MGGWGGPALTVTGWLLGADAGAGAERLGFCRTLLPAVFQLLLLLYLN